MSIDAILSRLDKVKQTGAARWIACCPAHADKNPSLAVRETDGGLTLLHCFAGCETPDVLAALGLDMNDLFPEGAKAHRVKPERRAIPASDVLRCVAHEALIVAAGAVTLPAGHPDRERIIAAAARLQAAADAAGVSP